MSEVIAGIPVSLMGWLAALALVVTWHEMGHLLVAWRCRMPVRLIGVGFGPTLWSHTLRGGIALKVRAVPLGMAIGIVGRREPNGRARRPVEHDLAVAAGGPAASFLLAALAIALWYPAQPWPGVQDWLQATAMLSVMLTLLNLLPIPGLDGGHLVVLSAARLGLQLSPSAEVRLHRAGLHLTTAACGLTLAGVMLRNLL